MALISANKYTLPLFFVLLCCLSACNTTTQSKQKLQTVAPHATDSTNDVATTNKKPVDYKPTATTPKPQEPQKPQTPMPTAANPASKLPAGHSVELPVKLPAKKLIVKPANQVITRLCSELSAKLSSVSMAECSALQLTHSAFTIQHRSLAYKDYPANSGQPSIGKILVIGGIHGDEFSSVSVIVKWMKILNQQPSNLFDWRFIPSANPDGLLQIKSQRQNYNGVDLNRNFPTADWQNHALNHWQNVTHRNPRRRPGPRPASEPETKWLVDQINTFAPEVIITLHAPYHLVDYDGPPSAPDNLGGLYLRRLGVFPGSLGNYAGNDLNKPVVTLELKSAGIMPLKQEIDQMWYDLVIWLQTQLSP